MQLGKVLGSVVSTVKTENIKGLKLLLVQRLSPLNEPQDTYVVAVDVVEAGEGDVVLYSEGSSSRQTPPTDKRPIDGIIAAVVDTWEVGGKEIYNKSADSTRKSAQD
jgi:carbon dioxide concentrating mechanism protein CcmL